MTGWVEYVTYTDIVLLSVTNKSVSNTYFIHGSEQIWNKNFSKKKGEIVYL